MTFPLAPRPPQPAPRPSPDTTPATTAAAASRSEVARADATTANPVDAAQAARPVAAEVQAQARLGAALQERGAATAALRLDDAAPSGPTPTRGLAGATRVDRVGAVDGGRPAVPNPASSSLEGGLVTPTTPPGGNASAPVVVDNVAPGDFRQGLHNDTDGVVRVKLDEGDGTVDLLPGQYTSAAVDGYAYFPPGADEPSTRVKVAGKGPISQGVTVNDDGSPTLRLNAAGSVAGVVGGPVADALGVVGADVIGPDFIAAHRDWAGLR